MLSDKNGDATQPLLVTAREAARALSISERTLWTLTQRGEIPCVRFGRLVRYDHSDLVVAIEALKSRSSGRNLTG